MVRETGTTAIKEKTVMVRETRTTAIVVEERFSIYICINE